MEITTKSAQETYKLGKKLANSLKSGGLLALYGELGSGKTTFIQGFARGLGIKQRILSPTFIIVREYPIPNSQAPITNFYHIDLYRLEKSADGKSLGLEEILADVSNVIAIEWPEKIKEILPEKRIDIYFENLGENERRITSSY